MPRMSVVEITTAWARIRALRAEAKVLEAEETDLKTRLQASIPDGTAKGGIGLDMSLHMVPCVNCSQIT